MSNVAERLDDIGFNEHIGFKPSEPVVYRVYPPFQRKELERVFHYLVVGYVSGADPYTFEYIRRIGVCPGILSGGKIDVLGPIVNLVFEMDQVNDSNDFDEVMERIGYSL